MTENKAHTHAHCLSWQKNSTVPRSEHCLSPKEISTDQDHGWLVGGLVVITRWWFGGSKWKCCSVTTGTGTKLSVNKKWSVTAANKILTSIQTKKLKNILKLFFENICNFYLCRETGQLTSKVVSSRGGHSPLSLMYSGGGGAGHLQIDVTALTGCQSLHQIPPRVTHVVPRQATQAAPWRPSFATCSGDQCAQDYLSFKHINTNH